MLKSMLFSLNTYDTALDGGVSLQERRHRNDSFKVVFGA
jgi:hypothetical protein